MIQTLKARIKQVLPVSVTYAAGRFRTRLASRKARAVFERAGSEPGWLDDAMIEPYHVRYEPPPAYGYDPETLAKRGEERALSLLKWLPTDKVTTFLELGCWDGMVSHALRDRGKSAIAIDVRSEGFDARARAGGANLLQMDVSRLAFADASFDVAFSFDGLEHFSDPERTLIEAVRVTKPGGYIYLEFGPLYMSPMGAHLYRQISIPYCQLLFHHESLQRFAESKGLGTLNFNHVNGYRVEDFRQLWMRLGDRLRRVHYYELASTGHLDLVVHHPTCFRSKTANFDNLIISVIRVLFQKIS